MSEDVGASDLQLKLLKSKITHNEKFTLSGLELVIKNLDTYEEYLKVRPLVELVSRSHMYHSKEYVDNMLSNPLFYPFLIQLQSNHKQEPTDNSESTDNPGSGDNPESTNNPDLTDKSDLPCELEVVGYFEIYLMPHLGRLFDSRLERVIVDPQYRNKGIFTYMLTFIIEFCTSTLKCNRIDLTSNNPVAERVYKSFKFDPVDTNTYRRYL